jgi:dual specificity tyrosine-phosphorylation-regulated kinase 2/3/4
MLTPYEKFEVLGFQKVWFVGGRAARERAKIPGNDVYAPNNGYDDKEGFYIFREHDHINYRYEVLKVVGKGTFGQVVKVFDHKNREFAAVKIVRNCADFTAQACGEERVLRHLLRLDPDGVANTVRIKDSFRFRNHNCMVFDLMSHSLFEVIERGQFKGLRPDLVVNFTLSVLQTLDTLARAGIVHTDLKPENILLEKPNKSSLRVIDFGSAVYEGRHLVEYNQTRFYRAPEVILGVPYGCPIDMWSVGCIVSELLTGTPLLPGDNAEDQLALMLELLGRPPAGLVERGQRSHRYQRVLEGRVARRGRGAPGSRDLAEALGPAGLLPGCRDFVARCLEWEPGQRMTPGQALRHPWLRGRQVIG